MSEQQYLSLVQKILKEGVVKEDRTGVGTKSIFGYQMRFNLQDGFPLLTTKKVSFSLIKSELLWFLSGNTNIKYLLQHDNHIWDEWAFENYISSKDYVGPDMSNFSIRASNDEEFNDIYQQEKYKFCQLILNDDNFANKYGDLGPIYGKQWTNWTTAHGETINQIKNVIQTIKENPNSRRLIVSAWNPGDIEEMALPPCHVLFQFYIVDGKLSCQLYQRSGDVFLGVPFNIASYSLLIHLIAKECNLEVGEFIHTLGDAHIYLNHIPQMEKQITRTPYSFPKLVIKNNEKSIFELNPNDIEICDYQHHPAINGKVAV